MKELYRLNIIPQMERLNPKFRRRSFSSLWTNCHQPLFDEKAEGFIRKPWSRMMWHLSYDRWIKGLKKRQGSGYLMCLQSVASSYTFEGTYKIDREAPLF
jgi:hypothetical protein